jgi:hypothetical protein
MALNGTPQGPSTVRSVVTLLRQPFLGAVVDFEGNTALTHLLVQAQEHDVHNLLDVIHIQRMEHNGFVNTIEKFGVEGLFQFVHDALFHLRERHVFSVLLEAYGRVLFDHPRAQIRSHDQDHVLEVNLAAVAIREMAVVHDLEQHVIDVWMGLFNFVQ